MTRRSEGSLGVSVEMVGRMFTRCPCSKLGNFDGYIIYCSYFRQPRGGHVTWFCVPPTLTQESKEAEAKAEEALRFWSAGLEVGPQVHGCPKSTHLL